MSFPNPERQTFLLYKRVAASAMPRMLLRLDEMFRHGWTGKFHFLPFKPARFGGFRLEQTVA
jgi:hypothetical protein